MRIHDLEEVLQAVWEEQEAGRGVTDARLGELAAKCGRGPAEPPDPAALRAAGHLAEAGDGTLAFTAAGRAVAERVVRKHRLTERLFHDVLLYRGAAAEQDACELEHVISDDAIDHICTLLGHPATCPDGKPIPPGNCCRAGERNVRALILPLTGAETGRAAMVVYIGAGRRGRLDQLAGFGLVPGGTVRVVQKQPSLVVQLGQTQLALDDELAAQVFVRHL